jgi:hypothetical protein
LERFVQKPNLPYGRVSLAVVDGRIPKDMEDNLITHGIRLIKTKKTGELYNAISYHPDIVLHHLGENEIVVAPNIDNSIVYKLEEEGFKIIIGSREVQGKYPLDVPYNVASFGEFVVCNVKYTDEILLQKFHEKGKKIINIKQGYAKCSICVVSDDAVITSDRGIHNILIENNINSLFITPAHIDLFEMSYGFIGGASGKLSQEEIAFYGNLELHPDNNAMQKFLEKFGATSVNLSKNKMLDLGTLIPLKEYCILCQ